MGRRSLRKEPTITFVVELHGKLQCLEYMIIDMHWQILRHWKQLDSGSFPVLPFASHAGTGHVGQQVLLDLVFCHLRRLYMQLILSMTCHWSRVSPLAAQTSMLSSTCYLKFHRLRHLQEQGKNHMIFSLSLRFCMLSCSCKARAPIVGWICTCPISDGGGWCLGRTTCTWSFWWDS